MEINHTFTVRRTEFAIKIDQSVNNSGALFVVV